MRTCENCNGKCCRYVAIEIDEPEDEDDYENILWYLLHEDILVFIDEKEWYVQFNAKCKKLGENNKCQDYENRPEICKELSTENCEFYGEGEPHDILFETPEDFLKYAKEKKFKWKRIKS